jgi:hypothetical protein
MWRDPSNYPDSGKDGGRDFTGMGCVNECLFQGYENLGAHYRPLLPRSFLRRRNIADKEKAGLLRLFLEDT